MTKRRMLQIAASLALCAALTFSGCGAFAPLPAYAADRNTAYTFGNPDGPFPDLYAEHQKQVKQREKERRKEEAKQAVREKAAMKKAAREARERERKDKAAKENTGE